MNDGRPFHLVDVFAVEPYTGNQLAVIRDAGDLLDDEMQALAREMAYSETAFVESEVRPARGATGGSGSERASGAAASKGGPRTDERRSRESSEEPSPGGGWDVRIFTPTDEIPFAGHPTLGTAAVVRDRLADGRPDEVTLNLDVGEIPVTVERRDGDEVLWMRQRPPEFGETVDPAEAAEVVGVDPDAVADDYPPQVVSTGLPTLVVPLRSLAAVRDAEIESQAYTERVVRGLGADNVLVFAPETYHDENDLNVRMFAPALGVPEDPATGSSNGCLAAWLARHRSLDSGEIAARVEQGYEIDRPSLLHLRATDDGDEVDVRVGGRVVPVADGELA